MRDTLEGLLYNSGFSSIIVEIVDASRDFMQSIFPEPVNTGSIEAYESVQDHVSNQPIL